MTKRERERQTEREREIVCVKRDCRCERQKKENACVHERGTVCVRETEKPFVYV